MTLGSNAFIHLIPAVMVVSLFPLQRHRKCLRFTLGLINVATNKSGLCQEESGVTAVGFLKPHSNKKHVFVFRRTRLQ